MPCDYTRYPKNWKEIRAEVLARAANRCECGGECAPGGIRSPHWPTADDFKNAYTPGAVVLMRCDEIHLQAPKNFGGKKVILTIAHLNHQTKDNRRKNLKAMCQLCHLRYDRRRHSITREMNRLRHVRAAGHE